MMKTVNKGPWTQITFINELGYDILLLEAVEQAFDLGYASAAALQRSFDIKYIRASRMIAQMEKLGIVAPSTGKERRELLMTREQWHEIEIRHALENCSTSPRYVYHENAILSFQ